MNKQQTTQAGWVSAQPQMTVETQPAQRTPTFKGETSGLRLVVFFALALFVALSVSVVLWELLHLVIVSFGAFAVILPAVFVPLYRFDTEVSTGLRHHKMQLVADDNKVWAPVALAEATRLNNEQTKMIAQLQDDVLVLQQAVESLRTVTITDRSGARVIPAHDDIDMSITAWLSQYVFGPDGMLTGVHEKSGALKDKYPFSGKDERSVTAHTRLTKAGLIGIRQPGNQYAWTGPITLSETRRKLTPNKGQTPT